MKSGLHCKPVCKGEIMKSNLSDVQQRVNRYWYTDGLAEILGGGMFLLLAVYFALQDFLGPDSTLSGILQASLALVLIGGAFVSRRLINSLKDAPDLSAHRICGVSCQQKGYRQKTDPGIHPGFYHFRSDHRLCWHLQVFRFDRGSNGIYRGDDPCAAARQGVWSVPLLRTW